MFVWWVLSGFKDFRINWRFSFVNQKLVGGRSRLIEFQTTVMNLFLIWFIIWLYHFFWWGFDSFVYNSFLRVHLLKLIGKFSFNWIFRKQTDHIAIFGNKIQSERFLLIHHSARLQKIKLKPLIEMFKIIMVQ